MTEKDFILPEAGDVVLSRHVKILATKQKCRGCNTGVRKYIDTTPDEILGKYLCNCVNPTNGELTGPQFPLMDIR